MEKPRYVFGPNLKKSSSTTPDRLETPTGCFERGRIRVKDVHVDPHQKDADHEIVRRIQESFEFTGGGCFQPIGVRRASEEVDGKDVIQNVLVFGAKRLQAQKGAGLKYIDCVFLSGSDTDVELIQVAENLLRITYSVLEGAEQTVSYYDLVGKKLAISGQLDQKRKRIGRRPGGMAQAARWLKVLGGTDEARRLRLRKAKAIAGIGETAKQIAKRTGLDNNQRALLWIAKAQGPAAQAKRAQNIADGVEKPPSHTKGSPAKAHTTKRDQVSGGETQGSTDPDDESKQPRSAEESPDDNDDDKNVDTHELDTNTREEDLEAFWGPEGKRLWSYTPHDVRMRFIEKLRRARCRAPVDLDDFIEKAFCGRRRIGCETLEAFARSKGMSWKAMVPRLKQLGYKKKRDGLTNGPHFYFNIDLDYKDRRRFFADAELARPISAKRDDDAKFAEEMERPPFDAAYLNFDRDEVRKETSDLIDRI